MISGLSWSQAMGQSTYAARISRRSAFSAAQMSTLVASSIWQPDRISSLITDRSVLEPRRAASLGMQSVSDRQPAGLPKAAYLKQLDLRSEFAGPRMEAIVRLSERDPGFGSTGDPTQFLKQIHQQTESKESALNREAVRRSSPDSREQQRLSGRSAMETAEDAIRRASVRVDRR